MRGEYEPAFYYPYQLDGSSPHAWGMQGHETPVRPIGRFIPTCVGNTRPPLPQAFCWPVHPHMRGEYYYDFGTVEDGYGSSPHAWGIHPRRAGTYRWRRFIPTCVGNTPVNKGGTGATTVHPHMRGEYEWQGYLDEGLAGSSPHAWGILHAVLPLVEDTRFIPTCVGNTHGACWMTMAETVHPHMRGEYHGDRGRRHGRAGSSPHAWGIRPLFLKIIFPMRFIPTCVGNTGQPNRLQAQCPVHPHMRGEYESHARAGRHLLGSSPHAWGILPRHVVHPKAGRFIPTCVGNTWASSTQQMSTPVHPHMRGEYPCEFHHHGRASGSSPHAWGIREPRRPRSCRVRFIPTCVGNTMGNDCWMRAVSVHPHMRGEYVCQMTCNPAEPGSSPHAWGIHTAAANDQEVPRFIPTCVGNTDGGVHASS